MSKGTQTVRQRQTARYEIIARLAREMTAILDSAEILRYAAQMIREWLSYPHVHFFMVDQASGDLVFVHGVSARDHADASVDLRIPTGKGIVGWVAEHGRVLNVGNVADDPRFVSDKIVSNVVSELAVPIKMGSRVLCVLDIASDQENAFDDQDEFALRTIADQMAVALENARLYQRLQASEWQYRDMIEHSHSVILVINASYQITFANHRAVELLHFSLE